MTIRRGEQWGHPVDRPADLVVVDGDHSLAAHVADGGSRPVAVDHGDLHRSLGSPQIRSVMQLVTIDLLRVVADGDEHVAVAHVVARRSWWRGLIVAAMNVDHLADWNVAPRAHPNDGRFDIVEVASDMGLRSRWQARARLPQGSHVPHPQIAVRTSTSERWVFDRPMDLWCDGRRVASVRELEVHLQPDAFALHL